MEKLKQYRHGRWAMLGIWLGLTALSVGCQPACQKMEPVITCTPPTYRMSELPSAFPALTEEEQQQEWSKELIIGDRFAHEWDLYRAITCYKRALILLPNTVIAVERRLQLDYDLMLCYYLGNKYQEAINIFEASDLIQVNFLFPAFNNLLIMLYDCYQQTGQVDKSESVLEAINKCSSETAEDLILYWNIKSGEVAGNRCLIEGHREKEELQADYALYDQFAKSPRLARQLNAILPGAGYYYVGQKRSAITSFIINALFIGASYQFFHKGYPAAGLITLSLETGWYLGGINGAGIEAQEFNTRLYEGISKKTLTDHNNFPILMFETSF